MTVHLESRRTLEFAGLEIEFILPDQEDAREALKLSYLPGFIPANFVSSLVSQTYGRDDAFKQSVLDALTPFQVASRMWAANALGHLCDNYDVDHVYYFGSWFGMQSAFDHRRISTLLERNKTYFDIDSTALGVSHQAHRDNFTADNSTWVERSVWDIPMHDIEDAGAVIVWTGIEHFDPEKIQEFVDGAPEDTRWILQGTNMPATDHCNLVNSCSELSKYFNTEPLLLSEMKTNLGSRFMAVL